MTEFRVGDKVRWNRVGTVVETTTDYRVGTAYSVEFDNYDASASNTRLYASTSLELVERPAPPVKVGDKVTDNNVANLPFGTVAISPGGLAVQKLNAFKYPDMKWHGGELHGGFDDTAVVDWQSKIIYLP